MPGPATVPIALASIGLAGTAVTTFGGKRKTKAVNSGFSFEDYQYLRGLGFGSGVKRKNKAAQAALQQRDDKNAFNANVLRGIGIVLTVISIVIAILKLKRK